MCDFPHLSPIINKLNKFVCGTSGYETVVCLTFELAKFLEDKKVKEYMRKSLIP